MQGWISIHRKLKEHWLWSDPVKLKWWIDILLTVNHAPSKVNIGSKLFECNRGQSVRSYKTWGEQWMVTKDTAKNFFRLLESDGMVTLENLTVSTRITICNFDTYQQDLPASNTQARRKKDASNTQASTNNNVNNGNNENNKDKSIHAINLSDEDLEIWSTYTDWFKDQGFKVVSKIENQLRPEQLLKLLADYDSDEIKDTLLSLENYKRAKGYSSVYLTLNKWLKKQTA